MRWKALALILVGCLGYGFPGSGSTADSDGSSADEQVLKAGKIGTDDASLLAFFRDRTVTKEALANIESLISQLGDNAFKVRQKASVELVKLGPSAIPFLERARASNADLEITRRAEECLRQIEEAASVGLPAAAARLLAVRKLPGVVEVLLAYSASGDESAADEVRNALAANALKEGQIHPALVKALEDDNPSVRAAAAVALVRSGDKNQLPAVATLLKDPVASVRLHAGLALAWAKEKDAIPVLIQLLGELDPGQSWLIEDMLYRLAEDKAPKESPGKAEAEKKKYRDAWLAWWKEHGEKIDLALLAAEPKVRGNNMVILLDQGKVLEMDRDNKVLWQIDNLQFPLDAAFVGEARVLIAENNGNVVCERTHDGKVIWETKVNAPIMAQRLPNGNTFIASRAQLTEVDKDGKQVFFYRRPDGQELMRAKKLPNGQIATVVNSRFVLLDAGGKELRSFAVDVHTYGGRIEVLPNGRLLAPCYSSRKIAEYDESGKIVWEAPVPFDQPISALRLANGNTLVTSMLEDQPAVEVDRKGTVVWQYKADSRVTRVYRR